MKTISYWFVSVANLSSTSTSSLLYMQGNLHMPVLNYALFWLSGYIPVYTDTAYIQPFFKFSRCQTTLVLKGAIFVLLSTSLVKFLSIRFGI